MLYFLLLNAASPNLNILTYDISLKKDTSIENCIIFANI